MKNYLALILTLTAITISSQTLTQTFNEPKVGDIDLEWRLDTSAYLAGMPVSVTGSNVVWNFSGVFPTTLISVAYVSPTAVPASTAYNGCNLVQQDGNTNTFLKTVSSPSAQTEVIGLDIGLGQVTLTNTAIAARFPISYGYSLTDNVSGSFTSTITNGSCSGSIVTTADGLGTLNLSQGLSFSNVLRVKSVLHISLIAGFIPLGTARQIIYTYYHASQKFPLLNLNYTALSFIGSSPSVTGVVNGNGAVIVGLRDILAGGVSKVKLYPNPAQSELRLDISSNLSPGRIILFNSLSQMVFSGEYQSKLDISGLEAGIYFLSLETNEGLIRQRFVKE